MPIYEYKALNAKGQGKPGILDADSPREAREKLRKQGLFVTDIRVIKDQEKRQKKGFLPQFFSGVSSADLAMVTRQLATLLVSGIPLAQSLQAIVEQSHDSPNLETTFRDIREQVMQGTAFADALKTHPRYFNRLYVSMVKAGEASGTLDQVLNRLAEYIQSQQRLKAKISAALAYPIVMILVGVGVVVYLMIKVVPTITGILEEQGKSLPTVTKMLIGLSTFFTKTWVTLPGGIPIQTWLLLPVLVLGMFLTWKAWVSTDAGRRRWDRLLLNMPLLGDLMRKVAVSRFAITFATLLRSGIAALEALRIVTTVVHNRILSDTLEEVHALILEGSDISTPIKRSGVFPRWSGT